MQYYTIENKLTDDGSYNARVLVNRTYDEDELIDEILETRSIVSKTDLKGVFAAIQETLIRIVKNGNGLNLPWLKLSFSMKGNFPSEETVRDPDEHPLEINVNAGSELTKVLPEIKLERVIVPDFGPRIVSYSDAVSRTVKSVATPGGTFKVTGDRLRIGGRRSENVGLYLRAEDDTETKVEVIMDNDPGLITGQLPDALTPGNYKLVVKTQLGVNGQTVNEVRTGISKFTLTVN